MDVITRNRGDPDSMPILPGAQPFNFPGGPTAALLLHGFTGSPASMRAWGEYLAGAGITVRGPRLPGHGTRLQDMNMTTWQDWYAEADRSFRDLREQHDNVLVMGLSMGGTLALRLAEMNGHDVAGLVLVNPAVHTERWDRHLLPILQRFVGGWPGIRNDIKKPGQDEVAYPKIPMRAAHSLSQLWTVVRADIHLVDQPLLMFNSRIDHVVEPSNGDWITSHVSSGDFTRIHLEDSYHVATLDNDAELIFSESLRFTERIAAATSE
jgi:carboxylesterase